MRRGFERTRKQWQRHGDEDPYFGVLSAAEARGGKWDREAFFATGHEHVAWVVPYLEQLGAPIDRGRALDFGCGVGRLTAALAEQFDEAHGVDISEGMLAEARSNVPAGAFHLNPEPDLRLFPDGHFDLVLSFIVLQHIPSKLGLSYVEEFVRVLTPTGCAVFQMPEELKRPSSWRDTRLLGAHVRNLGTRLKSRVSSSVPMEMHMTDRAEVRAAVERAGGELLEAVEDWTGGDFCTSVRYIARRSA